MDVPTVVSLTLILLLLGQGLSDQWLMQKVGYVVVLLFMVIVGVTLVIQVSPAFS